MHRSDNSRIYFVLIIDFLAILAFFRQPYGSRVNPAVWLIPQFILFMLISVFPLCSLIKSKRHRLVSMIVYLTLFMTVLFVAFFVLGVKYFGFLDGAGIDMGGYGFVKVFMVFIVLIIANCALLLSKIQKMVFYIMISALVLIGLYSFYDLTSGYLEEKWFRKDSEKLGWMDTTKMDIAYHPMGISVCDDNFSSRSFRAWCYFEAAKNTRSYEICDRLPRSPYYSKEGCISAVKTAVWWDCIEKYDGEDKMGCMLENSKDDGVALYSCGYLPNDMYGKCFSKVAEMWPDADYSICNSWTDELKGACISAFE